MNSRALIRIVSMAGALWVSACATLPGQADPKEAARANTQLGIEYMAQGQLERARDKLERAIVQDPTHGAAHAALAVLYQRTGRDADALIHFQQALVLNPNDSYTRNNYGAYLCARGKTREAMEQFVQVLKDQSYVSPEVALTNAGVCARKVPNHRQAEVYFRRALERAPKYPDALAQMALLNYDRRQFLKARAFLQRLESQKLLDREQLQLGMKIERALGDDQARSRYEAALRARHPDADNDFE